MTTYGPYTPVFAADNFLFVSGQIGVNPKTKQIDTTVARQTEQALKNMEAALSDAGASLSDVVKTTVFLTDMSAFSEMNATYEKAFGMPRPSRSTVAVKELPRVADQPLLVEIEAIAYKKEAA